MTLLQIQFSISQILLFVEMFSQITKQNSTTETAFHRTLERLDKILIKNKERVVFERKGQPQLLRLPELVVVKEYPWDKLTLTFSLHGALFLISPNTWWY